MAVEVGFILPSRNWPDAPVALLEIRNLEAIKIKQQTAPRPSTTALDKQLIRPVVPEPWSLWIGFIAELKILGLTVNYLKYSKEKEILPSEWPLSRPLPQTYPMTMKVSNARVPMPHFFEQESAQITANIGRKKARGQHSMKCTIFACFVPTNRLNR